MRNIAIAVVLILWVVLAAKMCSDYSACCPGAERADEAIGAVTTAVSDKNNCTEGMICFSNNSCEPAYGDNFDRFKDSLIALVSTDYQLKITGIYNTDETYDGTSNNLGTCRAEALATAFGLTADQIDIAGQLTVGRQVGIGERYAFDIVKAENATDSGTSSISDGALIYFPYNSTNKLDDRDIEIYLNQVANRIKDQGGRVRLVGHTDDKGREIQNQKLGQRRANVIADYLYGQGLLREQVMAESKGESAPVATNATEVGRAKNRRVELQIIR